MCRALGWGSWALEGLFPLCLNSGEAESLRHAGQAKKLSISCDLELVSVSLTTRTGGLDVSAVSFFKLACSCLSFRSIESIEASMSTSFEIIPS